MALTSLRLQSFKCFHDTGYIPIAPLTLIFGRNNTGKSSILQSLLLLRQSIESPEYGPRLNLRGSLYDAGSFLDLSHQHVLKNKIKMHFRIDPDLSSSRSMQLDLFRDTIEQPAVPIEIIFAFAADEPRAPCLSQLAVRATSTRSVEIRRGRGRFGPYTLYIGGEQKGNERKANFSMPVRRFLPLIGKTPPSRGRPNVNDARARMVARGAIEELGLMLTRLRAVGSFRQQPSRRYEYQGSGLEQVDTRGERVVDALIDDQTRRGTRKQLLQSVNRWLIKVGRVKLRPLHRVSKSARLYEIRVQDTDSGRWANFADVGFGIGQALPVLVEGLRTPERGMFLVQEPEMHLHPDAQLAMADFLFELASSGRQVLVETHSENILLRIRRRIVETIGRTKGPVLDPGAVSVLYVDKEKDGKSTVRPMGLDTLGRVANWPSNFMEEATEERMALLEATAAAEVEE